MAILLEGKRVAESVFQKLVLDVSLLPVVPKLSVILVGNDPASETYVSSKAKKCRSLGLQSQVIHLPETVSEEALIQKVCELNDDSETHGILIQLPLPKSIRKEVVFSFLNPLKDVDGLTVENAGLLAQGRPRLIPCTPYGVMEMLKFYSLTLEGKHAVILGRSEIVGKPMAQLLLSENATVTVCHSKTVNLVSYTQSADILIAALGKPKWVTASMIKEGAVVVDVGIHRTDKGLCGDVDFEKAAPKCKAISPVPGGVGPMTIAMLMKNVVQAVSLQMKLPSKS